MKSYPPQFKVDAVALYESRPDATIRSVAADLGINPETLRNWVRAAGASRPRGRRTQEPAQPPAPLEAENAALRGKVRELEEEREILRKAAKTVSYVVISRWSVYGAGCVELDCSGRAVGDREAADPTVEGAATGRRHTRHV